MFNHVLYVAVHDNCLGHSVHVDIILQGGEDRGDEGSRCIIPRCVEVVNADLEVL